jgi:hypothetical protein
MAHHASRSLLLATSWFCLTLCPTLFHANARADVSSVMPQGFSSGKQWASFDVTGSNHSGEIQPGQPLELSIIFGGIPQGNVPLVAICESPLFQLQVVRLSPDPASPTVVRATAILEPVSPSLSSARPETSQIRIVFARALDRKFEWVMTRIVHVTLGRSESGTKADQPSLVPQDDIVVGGPAMDHAEPQPDAIPVSGGHVVEEDLLTVRSVKHAQAYWRHVSDLVGQSWSRAVRRIPHGPPNETVYVQFRLYPDGQAQLIQVEEESGIREIDEAGIHTIMQAQPFPPFPKDVEPEPIDVHVKMKTGQKLGAHESRPVVNSQAPRSTPKSPKK